MLKNLRPGVQVFFTSDEGENLDGEILFSDDNRKFFMFQRPAKSGLQNTYDVYLYRHDNVKDMRIVKQNSVTSFPEIDLDKIAARSLHNEEVERERLKLFESDVPKNVRDLAEHLSKTLPADPKMPVHWEKPDLHVLEQTVIKPPYSVESVHQKNDSTKAKDERNYIRKLVENFYTKRSSPS
ncbi:unnamed protein product [Mesocestoides corti]|uniref:AD domain-containing protein n=1 Tax=Mesocestoides corti TaxID=53468 RepID=A0A0R3UPH5_MESCO|nr:unnamed protein product [Mesocestoides corti]